MSSIDVCIVSTRRPELLTATLDSFSARILSHLEIGDVYMNLDPYFGDEALHARCVEEFKGRFPGGIIFEPATPSFPAAVQRLWSATTSDFVLHMEEDWLALTDIDQRALDAFADPAVTQVTFHTAEKKWDTSRRGHLHRRNEYRKFLGIKIPLFRTFPIFTTSPCLLRGSFARDCAGLMDVTKDPEKQFYQGVNPRLERYVREKKSYIFSPDNKPVIEDIGRNWQTTHGVKKVMQNGSSSWEKI